MVSIAGLKVSSPRSHGFSFTGIAVSEGPDNGVREAGILIHGDHAVFHGKSPIFQPWAHPGVSACFCTGEAYPIYLFIPSPVFGFPLAALFSAVEYLAHARGIFCRYDRRFDGDRMALQAASLACKKGLFPAPHVVVRRFPKEMQEEVIRP